MEITKLDGLREFGEGCNYLNIILSKLFPDNIFLHNKTFTVDNKIIKTPINTTIKPDFTCYELKLVVEFDGDNDIRRGHFSDINVSILDNIKTNTIENFGYKVIRIPSYIQLDKTMIQYYFNINFPDKLYPTCDNHGFLHEHILLPGNFNQIGLKRFETDLKCIPQQVSEQIKETLQYRKQLLLNKNYSESDANIMVYNSLNILD